MSAAANELPRLLAGAVPGGGAPLAEHLAHHGLSTLAVEPATLIDAVERAGLHGRGGAAFPTATKLHAVARSRRRAIVVANGAEGEPASAKDRVLLTQVPHLVLDGAELVAEAVGALEAIVCVGERAHAVQAALAAALSERERAGRDAIPLRIAPVPERYVAGEETALAHHLDGGPALPTFTPPRPFERGVGGRPTLIQNVETLAHVALIARHGADWFRALGTAAEPGSTLVTVSGAVARPGVREVALGTSLETIVAHAGGDLLAARAVLAGGYFGTWIDARDAFRAHLTSADLHALGGAIGCGVLAVLPAGACGVAETARVAAWLANQSAGQCGPCVFGLAAIADALGSLVDGRAARGRQRSRGRRRAAPEDVLGQLRRWSGDVAGRGACRHPDGAVRFVRSALDAFREEMERHAHHGACGACVRAPLLPLPGDRTAWSAEVAA